MAYEPKSMILKNIPQDVRDAILDKQNEQKKTHTGKFSMDKAVYSLIREHIKMKKDANS